jgi:hypothetical protein
MLVEALQRGKTGFPAKADTDTDGRYRWWQADIDTFYTHHLAHHAAKLTHVDRTGRPWRPAGTGIGPAQRHPYADDPHLDTAFALITEAEVADNAPPGWACASRTKSGNGRTGQRLIATALNAYGR